MKIIDIFDDLGVRIIGITGGEPLAREDIITIIKNIYDRGIYIYLSTNCDYYKRFKNDLQEYVELFGIPLESADMNLHNSLRGKGNFSNIEFALRDIFENGKAFFKIGTIVNKKNYKNLNSIEKYLGPFRERLACWKLYELIQYEEIKSKSDALYMECADYLPYLNNLGSVLGRDKIVYYSSDMRSRSYLLIRPNGDIFIPILEGANPKEMHIGNIIRDDIDNIIELWFNEFCDTSYASPNRMVIKRYKKCLAFD